MAQQTTQADMYIGEADVIYTEDIIDAMGDKYLDGCLHLAIIEGEVSFEIEGAKYIARKGDCIIKPGAEQITDVKPSDDFRMQGIIASNRFLRLCVQDDSYKTKGLLSMLANPIMPTTLSELEVILADIQTIKKRVEANYHTFFMQVLKRAMETLILDLQDVHARLNPDDAKGVSQSAKLLRSFIGYLQAGLYRRERKVDYYAALLFITPKYLSEACIKASGHNASFWIDRYTTEEISKMLLDEDLTFTQIADRLHFSSMNYFTRYVKRTLGMSPTEYRAKIVGKK